MYRNIRGVIVPAAILSIAVACGDSAVQSVIEPAQPSEITVKVLPATVAVGGQIRRVVEFSTSSDGWTWSSDDPKIATVSDGGMVTGVAPGTATVRAQKGSMKGSTQITVIGGFTRFVTGARHACATTASDDSYCWGNASHAELGTRLDLETCPGHQHDCSSTPRALSTTPKFSFLAAGEQLTCGLTREGEAYCWGSSPIVVPVLSDSCKSETKGAWQCSYTPVRIPGEIRFTTLSVKQGLACGLTKERKAYCWGYQLGYTPVAVPGDHRFQQLSTGDFHACGITQSGELLCWGGHPELKRMLYGETPVRIGGADQWISVSASMLHTCGVKADGSAHCWGHHGDGRLGHGLPQSTSDTEPVSVAGGIRFVSVAAALEHTCGLSSGGKAYCWGMNKYFNRSSGFLGIPAPPDRSRVPVAVSRNLSFVELQAGRLSTCGRTAEGKIYCWGDNAFGQLGHGDLSVGHSSTPVGVAGVP